MNVLFWIYLVLYLAYVLLGLLLIIFIPVKSRVGQKNNFLPISFSIIIPFRNESKYLPSLIQSLARLDYNKNDFEIILINDHSNDDSYNIVSTHIKSIDNIKLYNLPEGHTGKKQSLQYAVNQTSKEYLLFVDADCIVPEGYLKFLSSSINGNPVDMLIGLVDYKYTPGSFLRYYGMLENYALQAITYYSAKLKKPLLCSGANLIVKKEKYPALNELNPKLASGDDVHLLEYFKKKNYNIDVVFNSKQIVFTDFDFRLRPFFNRRIRWAGKMKHSNVFAGAGVLLFFITVKIGVLILAIMNIADIFVFAMLFSIKLLVDILFISSFVFPKNRLLYIFVPIFELIYPVELVFTALFSFLTKKSNWKGRNISISEK